MEAKVLQSNFKVALDRAVLAVENKPSIPVMGNVLLHAEHDRLHLRAANLSKGFSIRISIGANVSVDGESTLPAKALKELTANLSNDAVDIKLNKTTETTRFKCGGSTSNIKGISADEFIPYRDIEGVTFAVGAQHLKNVILSSSVAAADEDHRPALTGIFMRLNGDCTMTVAAADGYRLFVDVLPISSEVSGKVLVPHDGMLAVAKMIDKDEGEVLVTFNDEYIKVVSEHWEVGVQLLDSKFPPFESVIPKSYNTTLTVNREELLQAIKAAKVFARDSAFSARFEFQPGKWQNEGKLLVIGRSQERGDFTSEIDAKYEGQAMMIFHANIVYMQDFVAMKELGEVVQFNYRAENEPATITVPGKTHPIYVIMPMAR